MLCCRLQVTAVRAALDKYADQLDEGLLSNCFAWMKKCQDDRMDTMVALLQKVLQLYAAKALRGQEAEVMQGRARHLNLQCLVKSTNTHSECCCLLDG